ncbi:MAG: glycosyltransferase family 4 protein [bacterium]|nr:glycosyltransferase family 4 protein [bacterium]
MNQKNILILINVRWWNATAFYAVNISRILHKNGHRVIVGCSPGFPAFQKARNFGLETAALNFYGYNIFRLIRDFFRMLRLIRKEKIMVINAHRSEDQAFALLAKLLTGVRFVITRGDQRRIRRGLFSRIKYSLADAVVLTCRSILEQNRKALPKKKVSVIHGSVDEEHFRMTKKKEHAAKKYGVDPKNIVIGMAGRLDYVKDQYTFVNACGLAAKQLKKVSFIVAGKQEHIKMEELHHLAQKWNIEKKLILLPRVTDIPDVINLFDISVITSIGSETISRVLLEYLYLKKPVIGTDINVIPEIIRPGYNGEIVKPGDYHSLAERIINLARDRRTMKLYSRNSFSLYKKFYSEKIFYKEYNRVFQSVI